MGGHYGSIHVRTDDAAAVRTALTELSLQNGTRFLLAPPLGGWITAFPHENGQDFAVSEALASKVAFPLLHCLVHDDDIFSYQYFERGALVDTFNSCPDYFGGEPAPRGGDVGLLQSILPEAARREKVKQLLDEERPAFEVERLERFATILGLPNAVTAYEYLLNGERDGISRWKDFIHIPDLTAEKAAKRTAKARARAQLKQLAKDGLLTLEITGGKTSDSWFPSQPVWCIEPNSQDAFLVWTGSPMGPATPTRLNRVNLRTGNVTETPVVISAHASRMAASSGLPWVAIGCACGDRKTEVWNWENGEQITEVAQSRAADQVCFSQDGQTLFVLSQETITIAGFAGTGSRSVIRLPEAGRSLALHPGGDFLAVAAGGTLVIVHRPTERVLASIWIPEPPGPRRDLMEYARSAGVGEKFLTALDGHIPKEELDKQRTQMARHLLPKQGIFSLCFGPSGNHLMCGTTAGLCVLEWSNVLKTADLSSIDPLAFVPSEDDTDDEDQTNRQMIYSTLVDPVAKRILFAGLEGKVRYINLADGRVGDLLAPPLRMPLFPLELSPDRLALVGTARPKVGGRGKPEPSKFQVWNYQGLCEAAGLSW